MRAIQRRQTWQGGKRGRPAVLWGLCVTAAALDAPNDRPTGLERRGSSGFRGL